MEVTAAQEAPVDILLIGLGSIGSVFAYLLERSGKARVTAVARSNYNLYTKIGVTLDTDRFGVILNWRPYRVVKSQAEALEGDVHYEFCIVATKCLPDILPTSTLVADAIASGKIGSWSLVQNGLSIEDDLYSATKYLDQPIISTCAWIGIMTNSSGDTISWRSTEVLVSGLYSPLPPSSPRPSPPFTPKESHALFLWRDLLLAGEAKLHIEDRIDQIRFSKNIWNCAWSSIEGLINGTPDTFMNSSPEDIAPLQKFIQEVVDTGFKSGLLRQGMVQYPTMGEIADPEAVAGHAWSQILNVSIGKVKKGISPHKMSLLVDVQMGRPFEVEVITGAVYRIAKAHGLDTPHLALMYSLMKGLQTSIRNKAQNKTEVAA